MRTFILIALFGAAGAVCRYSVSGWAYRLLGAGLHVALSIAGGAGAGYWLDGRLETKPALTLVGLGLGLVVAFAGMIRILSAMWDAGGNGEAEPPQEKRGSGGRGSRRR